MAEHGSHMISGAGLNLSREATLSTEWNISKLDYFLDLKSTIISASIYCNNSVKVQ